MKSESRTILIYTPNYGVKRFKIAFDSRVKSRFKDVMEAAKYYENKKAEDSDIKAIYASAKISNEEILYTYNCTMELATPKTIALWDKYLSKSKK